MPLISLISILPDSLALVSYQLQQKQNANSAGISVCKSLESKLRGRCTSKNIFMFVMTRPIESLKAWRVLSLALIICGKIFKLTLTIQRATGLEFAAYVAFGQEQSAMRVSKTRDDCVRREPVCLFYMAQLRQLGNKIIQVRLVAISEMQRVGQFPCWNVSTGITRTGRVLAADRQIAWQS